MKEMPIRGKIQKTYRLDTRQADDLEYLAENSGRTQNDLIVLAIEEFLYENRIYFIDEMIQEKCVTPLEHDVLLMKEEAHLVFGGISLDVVHQPDNEEVYEYMITIHNNRGHEIYKDTGEVVPEDKKDWTAFIQKIVEITKKYITIDELSVKKYFRDRFSYR